MNNIYHNIPPLSKDACGRPFSLTGSQKKRIRSLVLRECCNYDSFYGECLGPDRDDNGACIQLGAGELTCRWMEYAVLPLDPALQAEIIWDPSRKHCARCGTLFLPRSNRAMYCPACASQVKKEHKRESARKRRAGRQGLTASYQSDNLP